MLFIALYSFFFLFLRLAVLLVVLYSCSLVLSFGCSNVLLTYSSWFSFQLLYFLPFYFLLTLYFSLFIFSLYIVFLDFLSFLSKIFFSSLSIFKTACLTSWSSVNEFCPRTIKNTRALFGGLIGIAIQKHRFAMETSYVFWWGKKRAEFIKIEKGGFQRG